MESEGIKWTLKHPGLTHREFLRLVELDEKCVNQTLTRDEELECEALLNKVRAN